jgi:hypothetical protein
MSSSFRSEEGEVARDIARILSEMGQIVTVAQPSGAEVAVYEANEVTNGLFLTVHNVTTTRTC